MGANYDNFFSEATEDLFSFLASRRPGARIKINHGFWDRLTWIRQEGHWPLPKNIELDPLLGEKLDLIAREEGAVSSGIMQKVCDLLGPSEFLPENFKVSLSLVASPAGINGPIRQDSLATLQSVTNISQDPVSATLPKYLVENNRFANVMKALENREVIIVANGNITGSLCTFGSKTTYINIPAKASYFVKDRIIQNLKIAIENSSSIPVIIMQAGPLSLVLSVQLEVEGYKAQWLDMGVALSVICPDSMLDPTLPWFITHYEKIMNTHHELVNRKHLAFKDNWLVNSDNGGKVLRKSLDSIRLNDDKESFLDLYRDSAINLPHLPSLRLKLISLLIAKSQNNAEIIEILKQEAMNFEAFSTFNACCLLAKLLSETNLDEEFHSVLLQAKQLAPNDPAPFLIEVQFFQKRKAFSAAKNLLEQEIISSASQLRVVRNMKIQLQSKH